MTKEYRCAAVMANCDATILGRDSAEVMARVMAHIIKDHGIAAPPFEVVTAAHASIRDCTTYR
jgi:predicted small metal-binding protein